MKLELSGLDEFTKMINEYDKEVQKEIMKKSFNSLAKPLIEKAKTNTNSTRVQKALGAKYYPDGNYGIIGARTSKKYQGFIANFLEAGTKERTYRNSKRNRQYGTAGHRTGKIKATWFFFRAFKDSENEMMNNLFQTFQTTFDKVMAKYNKKG